MDLFKINWKQRATNDPVVNEFFKEYIFQQEHITTNTSDIKIKDKTIKKTKTNKTKTKKKTKK